MAKFKVGDIVKQTKNATYYDQNYGHGTVKYVTTHYMPYYTIVWHDKNNCNLGKYKKGVKEDGGYKEMYLEHAVVKLTKLARKLYPKGEIITIEGEKWIEI